MLKFFEYYIYQLAYQAYVNDVTFFNTSHAPLSISYDSFYCRQAFLANQNLEI